jgi:hypothetical protein
LDCKDIAKQWIDDRMAALAGTHIIFDYNKRKGTFLETNCYEK